MVLPVLLLLVMGSLEWGYYFFQEQVVVNAAREGARAGSVAVPATSLDRAKAVAASSLAAGTLDATRAVITADPGTGSVIVTVTYPLNRLTGINVGVPVTAFARSEMRR